MTCSAIASFCEVLTSCDEGGAASLGTTGRNRLQSCKKEQRAQVRVGVVAEPEGFRLFKNQCLSRVGTEDEGEAENRRGPVGRRRRRRSIWRLRGKRRLRTNWNFPEGGNFESTTFDCGGGWVEPGSTTPRNSRTHQNLESRGWLSPQNG